MFYNFCTTLNDKKLENLESDIYNFMIIKCNKYREFDRYSIGNSDLINGVEYGWLYTLSKQTKHPYTMVQKFIGNSSMPYHIELANGPDTRARYVIRAHKL